MSRRPAGEFYNIRKMMVLVEITLQETYRKLAGFYPFAEGALSAAREALIYRPGNFGPRSLGLDFWRLQGGPPMDNKPAQNIQDSFLNTARKDKSVITIYLLSGVKLSGRIRSFDKYSVILETSTLEQLVFKHSISAAGVCRNPHCPECFPGRNGDAPATGRDGRGNILNS